MSDITAVDARPHYPVMLPEVMAHLAPRDGEVYVDGTFGYGGYSEAFLKAANCRVIGLDRDINVRARADALSHDYDGRFKLIQTPFSLMDGVDLPPVDAVVLDIGVSSMQLDQAARGFSFMRSGPLDMRMGPDGPTAAMAVNQLGHGELANIFKTYGEERQAGRIASAILRAREDGDIITTDALADLIEKTVGRPGGKGGKTHPATRVFQALRIFVNDELGELYRGLCAAEAILKPGGRLIVVTFHSLEDRIVKSFFRRRAGEVSGGSRYAPEIIRSDVRPSFDVPRRAVVKPSASEVTENPRSRSAKLRCAIRTDAPMYNQDETLLPKVPSVHDIRWAA
ncbi:16S rRNA (cytosine(1402)-N(4))-methyltransferase RsmH [Fretibacter rubidus]|uniref:16S rRNA (cytosine(1402)-N(4))-methyltransferase RsmH n=1 Tax=Fretibacter rubidus TaxID=570162 RepID=UPI00352AB3D1